MPDPFTLAKELASIRGVGGLPSMNDLQSAEQNLAAILEANGGVDGKGLAAGLYQ